MFNISLNQTYIIIILVIALFIFVKLKLPKITKFINQIIYKLKNKTTIQKNINEVSTDIVLKESEIENEIYKCEKIIIEKEQHISELSLEIQNLKIELNHFESKYNAKVGILYAELDKLNLKIKEYEYRIKLAKNKKLSSEDLQKIEKKVEENFSEERKKVQDLENDATQSSQEYEQYIKEEEIKLDEKTEEEIKQLYRKLAKKYHPDMANNEEERNKFHKIMADINNAYKEKDIETLRKYILELEEEEKISKETSQEKFARLKNKAENLDDIITKVLEELDLLKMSETYKLMEKVKLTAEEGVDLLEQLAEDIQKQISTNQNKLDKLILEYQQIIEGVK